MIHLRTALRAIVVLLSLWLVLVTCTGCQLRETNKALQQGVQATQGAQQVLAEDVAPAVASLPPELQAKVKAALEQVCQLLTSAQASMQPALIITAGDEPPPQVDTTVEEAVERPHDFTRKAAQQVGRAQVEAERIGWWLSVGAIALQFGQAVVGDFISQLLLLLGGGGVAGAAGLKIWRLIQSGKALANQLGQTKRAVADAVQFGNDAAEVPPDDAAARQALIDRHKERQRINGTQALIKEAGAAVRSPPSAIA
jgi:hypothetical protein